MRTIESTATVTNEGTLIVPAPDLRPGSYHVVVIETASAATGDLAAPPPANDAWERLNNSVTNSRRSTHRRQPWRNSSIPTAVSARP